MTVTASTATTDEAPAQTASAAKRARFLAATGLPAVLVAGGVILPAVANAAPAGSGSCPAGTTASPAAPTAPTTAAPTAPLPSAGATTTATAGATQTQQPAPPAASGSTTAPAPPKPTGTSAPAPSTSPSSVPSTTGAPASGGSSTPAPAPSTSTSAPSGGPTWWAPWTWLNSTTPSAAIFNPTPTAQAGIRNAAVNQLGSAKVANPAVVAALATTTGSPASGPTAAPTSAPKSTATSTPAAPAAASSATSAPSTSTSTAPAVVCVRPMSLTNAALAGSPFVPSNEALWHLDATSLTLYGMTYNGVVTIPTANGPVNVLDFTADSVDVVSMITYSANPVSGKNDYANGGTGQTVHLTQVHLHVLQQTGNLGGLLPVTLAPGNLITNLLGITQGVKLPIPMFFTNVHVDQYLLTAKTLAIPGFNTSQQQ